MRIACEVTDTELENDDGLSIESVCVTCSRCDHEEEAYGRSDRSVRRCLVQLRENCPNGESNFYVAEESP